MSVDREWMLEHLGADAPVAESGAAAGVDAAPEDPGSLTREVIDFDSEAPSSGDFLASSPLGPPTLRHMLPIPWPDGKEPEPAASVSDSASLPNAQVLIVTWTVDEGHALSRVLTPGFDSHPPGPHDRPEAGMQYWKPYTKNFDELSAHMSAGSPAREAHRLGTYWTATIAGLDVTLFKSDSHLSQDGARGLDTTPNRRVWAQIIGDVNPRWVITTGTAGGIGADAKVGDVIVSRFVSFQADGALEPSLSFASPTDAPGAPFHRLGALLTPNAQFLPDHATRQLPKVRVADDAQQGVLTTGGFDYDDSANTDHLQGHGLACEMGDAVLGSICKEMGSSAPNYVCVRNVSDPEIDASDGTPAQQRQRAGLIYKQYGKWSSVCSAIICWAIVAGQPEP
jgi:nucleoside phosphorylase